MNSAETRIEKLVTSLEKTFARSGAFLKCYVDPELVQQYRTACSEELLQIVDQEGLEDKFLELQHLISTKDENALPWHPESDALEHLRPFSAQQKANLKQKLEVALKQEECEFNSLKEKVRIEREEVERLKRNADAVKAMYKQ